MEGFLDVFTVELLNSGIRLATPVILAGLGGALCNKAGVLNLALESKMLMGAFIGIIAAFFLGNSYLGILVAMAAGAILGLFFAFLYHRYDVDLVILAIAFNLIIMELTVYAMRVMFGNVGTWSDPGIVRIPDFDIPFLANIPVIGDILNGYNIIVYFSWIAALALFIILYKMKFGRHIRAVGENKEIFRHQSRTFKALLLLQKNFGKGHMDSRLRCLPGNVRNHRQPLFRTHLPPLFSHTLLNGVAAHPDDLDEKAFHADCFKQGHHAMEVVNVQAGNRIDNRYVVA